jgi:hypothetical protein
MLCRRIQNLYHYDPGAPEAFPSSSAKLFNKLRVQSRAEAIAWDTILGCGHLEDRMRFLQR